LKVQIDTQNEGLEVVLKDYQAEAMKLLWNGGNGEGGLRSFSSREVWQKVNESMKHKTISRASIINFLNAMVDDGVLVYRETTGKGGHRRIYSAGKTEQEFWVWLIDVVSSKLKEAAGLYHM